MPQRARLRWLHSLRAGGGNKAIPKSGIEPTALRLDGSLTWLDPHHWTLAVSGCWLRLRSSVGRTGIIMNGETERDLGTPRKGFTAPALLGSALLAVCFNASTPAMADAFYDWQGTCTLGCAGLATGVLTLGD